MVFSIINEYVNNYGHEHKAKSVFRPIIDDRRMLQRGNQSAGTTERVCSEFSGQEQGCFLSVNVSVCLCVIVLNIRFAFSFALESLRDAGKEEGNKTAVELYTNYYKRDDLLIKSLSPRGESNSANMLVECEKNMREERDSFGVEWRIG